LTPEEFNSVSSIKGKKVHKIRYYYPYQGRELEIGVFQGELKGLVLIDVEFKSKEDMKNFKAPDFSLKEVVNKGFLAGGKLCGKKYEEIENFLNELGYKKI